MKFKEGGWGEGLKGLFKFHNHNFSIKIKEYKTQFYTLIQNQNSFIKIVYVDCS